MTQQAPEPRGILIIRTSAIGDVVMASPMLPVLRQAFPLARIGWLAEPAVTGLLRHHPDLDEIVLWPKNEWKKLAGSGRVFALAREIMALRRRLRGNFDLVLDAQGLLRTRSLAWLSGASERVGFKSKEPGEALLTRVVGRGEATARMSSEYRFLMTELGLDPGDFLPSIVVSPEAEERGMQALREAGVKGPFAVLAPFTTRPQKHWPDGRWGELVPLLQERLGLVPVAVGAPCDSAHAADLKRLAPRLADLTGRTTLEETAALVKNASLVVGVDTGVTHMGTAFRRPTVAIFGSTCPYTHTGSPRTVVLYHPHECSPCRRTPTCAGDFPCMAAVTAEEAAAAAERMTG